MKSPNNLDNIRTLVCQDIIRDYSLQREDIFLLLRVHDFMFSPSTPLSKYEEIEEVNLYEPIIDPDDPENNPFIYGKIKS